jgi:hypothetical protein
MNRLLLEYISKILSESSPASEQAKQMGLDYLGFGQWGKDGKVTHKSADKDGTMLIVYTPKTEDTAEEPEKDTKKRKSSYSSYPEIQAEDLNAASLANKVRDGIKAPGNDFSKYQEAVSIFIAKYIVDNPDATDQEIMERIVLLDCGSKLLTKDVKATLPKKYASDYNDLKQAGAFSTCSKDYKDDQNKARFATMLFAKKKAELMLSGIEKAKLDSPRIDSFSGDQDSLNSLRALIKSSTGKIYSPEGNELKKDEVIGSISGFGTSDFPADTSLIAIDRFGNMVFVGYSDKKDLNAIINNSTVTSEMSSHIRELDSLLNREVLSQELYDDLAGNLYKLESEYNNIESELKTATLGPARDLVEISKNNPEQLTELVARAKTLSEGAEPDKYFNKLAGPVLKSYRSKSSKVFKLWEPLLTEVGWDGESEPTEEQILAAFAIKALDVLDTEDASGWTSYPISPDSGGLVGEATLTKDAQELLFRLMVPDGSPQKKEFVEKVGVVRDRSLKILAEAREQLDKVTVGLEDGSSVKLGTYLDAIQAWRALHLDMSKYDGSLVMAAEDIIVSASDLIRCMKGVNTYEEFSKTLDISTKRITDRSYGTVTGQNVEIFAINPEGKRIKIGTRSIRSKNGILGKLQTTYNYHKDFQQCLRGKSGGNLSEGVKPNKLLLEYLNLILNEVGGKNSGDTWLSSTGKSWGAKNQEGHIKYFTVQKHPNARELAQLWASGNSSGNLPSEEPSISVQQTDTEELPVNEPMTPTEISEDGKIKILGVLRHRMSILNDITEKGGEQGNRPLERHKAVIDELIVALEETPPNIKEIKNILNKNKIISYQNLMDSPLFGPVDGTMDHIKREFAGVLSKHLPGLLSGTYSEKLVGIGTRITTKELYHDQPVVTDSTSDGKLSLAGQEIKKIKINSELTARIDKYLDEKGLVGKERERERTRIFADIASYNRRIDFIERHTSKNGLVQLPKGSEGASMVQDRLTNALFEDENKKEVFNKLTGAFKNATEQGDIDLAWKELQKFLSSEFPEGGIIPAICEQLTAIRIMQTEPDATIFMPVSETFPVGDVIVIRPPDKDGDRLELVTVSVEVRSVKRGQAGAPSSVREQLNLTVMSDDMDVSGDESDTVRSRDVILGLVDGTDEAEKMAMKLLNMSQKELDSKISGSDHGKRYYKKVLKCMCEKPPETGCEKKAKTLTKKYQERAILFDLLYEKFVVTQSFTNMTFGPDGITRSNGRDVKAQVSPDWRAKCPTKKTGKRARLTFGIHRGRAYLKTTKSKKSGR